MSRQTVNEWAAPCGCVIRYRFDPSEPEGRRKHTAVHHDGRTGCAEHFHDDHHVHYRNLRQHHHAAATKADPKHGWWLVVEEDGGIRDMKD